MHHQSIAFNLPASLHSASFSVAISRHIRAHGPKTTCDKLSVFPEAFRRPCLQPVTGDCDTPARPAHCNDETRGDSVPSRRQLSWLPLYVRFQTVPTVQCPPWHPGSAQLALGKGSRRTMASIACPAMGRLFFSHVPSTIPRLSLLLLLCLATAPMALGHDHSSNHIPEGKTISDDPIVRAILPPKIDSNRTQRSSIADHANFGPPSVVTIALSGYRTGDAVYWHPIDLLTESCRTQHYGFTSSFRWSPGASSFLSAWSLAYVIPTIHHPLLPFCFYPPSGRLGLQF